MYAIRSYYDSMQDLNRIIFDKLPTHNVFFAIRIDGEFNNVKTRAIPKQKAPYEKLAKVVDPEPKRAYTRKIFCRHTRPHGPC